MSIPAIFRKSLKLLCVCFLVLCALSAHPQGKQMTFGYLTTKDGLLGNRVQAFCRDHENYLWIGIAENGLNRYDGHQLTAYEHYANIPGTISSNSVRCIFEDGEHRLWVGTYDGLSRYNPDLNNFTVYRHNSNDSNSLGSNWVSAVTEDNDGAVWVATEYTGLNKWKAATNDFVRYRIPDTTSSQLKNRITALARDSHGNFWIVGFGKGIYHFTPKTGHFTSYYGVDAPPANSHKVLCIDDDDQIWIGTFGDGLYLFDPNTATFKHFDTENGGEGLSSNMIRAIIQDDANHLLIGTDQGGINLYNKTTGTFEYIQSNENQDKGLNNNGIVSLYKDWEGILWVGTSRGGVNYYNPKESKFKQYSHNPVNPKSLSHYVVGCLFEDYQGMIWVGTDGGGVNVLDPKTGNFIAQYKHDPNNPYSISGNVIRCIAEDQDHDLWISTWGAGLNRYDRKTGRFHRYLPKPGDSKGISSKTIWHFTIDNDDNLWLGGYETGIEVFNKKQGVINRLNTDSSNSGKLSSNNVCFTYVDGSDKMWVCTNYGLNLYNRTTDSITVYRNFPDNNIRAFCKDKAGRLWAGSVNRGFYLFEEDGTIKKIYDKTFGLPDNTINAIIEDSKGLLWISTRKGLCRFNPNTETFRIYTETDGLLDNNLFEQSFLKTRSGEIYIGSYHGFNSFHPDSLKDNNYIPQVFITDFKLFNKPVAYGVPGALLSRHISQTDTINLSWHHSVLSFGFTAINYTSSAKSSFAYKMEGFEQNWNYVGTRREATYTNLDPGEYVFKVKAANNDGVWSQEDTAITIHIAPPFWKTGYAYTIYIMIMIGLILLSQRIVRERERLKLNIEQEKQKAVRERELDLMKLHFFTNISHEFRTPLSLIISPIDKLVKQATDLHSKQNLELISRNAKRLMLLINQLLDFRKMEAGQLKLNTANDDIVKFVREVSASFSDISENKNIQFSFSSNIEQLAVCFDKDKLEKILLNLLSNAFKFTTENGNINLNLQAETPQNTDIAQVQIKVSDTGIGIPVEQQAHIFDRFFQNDMPNHIINQGSGIGLSITHEFVKLHGGTIHIDSEVDKGSCFTVLLPLKRMTGTEQLRLDTEQFVEQIAKNPEQELQEETTTVGDTGYCSKLLLVDDNEDFRFYLKDNLRQNYCVAEAKNGKEAWEMVLADMPDLIISDVMMPEMDGFEFCALVKQDKRTCHIPVILLTAKTSTDNKLEGLEIGADDYVAKPFYFELLESRIKNIIHQREILRDAFREKIVVEPSEINVTSLDEKLLKKAFELVEQHIDNPDFSVVDLSTELGMSRGHLYQKLLAITGKSPLEFIRSFRLKRASQLLKESQLSVAEIAYQVGFNNPKLFTKHFKTKFGVTPSQYMKNMGSDE